MTLRYDDIKSSLSPELRAQLEGKKARPEKPKAAKTVQVIEGKSAPQSPWVNCENGCMGRMNGPATCDMCGGRMIPGLPL